LSALLDIESEVVSSTRPGIDHQVAHARLQWWSEECARAAQGRPVHPLTRRLIDAGAPSPLDGLSGFVDTAVWDLAGATFETRKELTAYCERWSAAMFQPSAAVGSASNAAGSATSGPQPASNATAGGASGALASSNAGGVVASSGMRWRVLGAAVREIELLANLARDARAGRLRLPLDELDAAGVDVKAASQPPWPAPLVGLLRERHQALRASLSNSLAGFTSEEQAHFRGLMVWTALAWRQSVRAERALPNVSLPRRYHAFTDGWKAWRAARHAAAGNLTFS
jgi:phytoene synthase